MTHTGKKWNERCANDFGQAKPLVPRLIPRTLLGVPIYLAIKSLLNVFGFGHVYNLTAFITLALFQPIGSQIDAFWTFSGIRSCPQGRMLMMVLFIF